jgi:hypothetical protein
MWAIAPAMASAVAIGVLSKKKLPALYFWAFWVYLVVNFVSKSMATRFKSTTKASSHAASQ